MLVSSWTYANKNLVANWPKNNSYWSILIQSGNILPLKSSPFWYPLASTMILSSWAQVPRYSILDPSFVILKVWSFDPCNTFKLGYRDHWQPTDTHRCFKIKISWWKSAPNLDPAFLKNQKTIIELIFLHPLTQRQLMERDFGRQRFHDLDGDPTSKNLQNTQGIFTFGMPNKARAWMLHVGIYAAG